MTDIPFDPARDASAGSADEPLSLGPVLPEADDAFVAGILAASGDDLPPVPAEVAARWDAAIVAEAQTRAAQDAAPTTPSTVVPMHHARPPRARGLRFAGIAASVAALALVGGVVANQVATSTTSDTVITEASGSLPTTDEVTTSGSTFSDDTVRDQAGDLVAKAYAASSGAKASAPATLPPDADLSPRQLSTTTQNSATAVESEPEVEAFVADEAQRDACIANLAQQEGAKPVAVDIGYYKGEPAAMVVLPSPDDPTKVDVFIVGPDCDLIDADVQYFVRVDVAN